MIFAVLTFSLCFAVIYGAYWTFVLKPEEQTAGLVRRRLKKDHARQVVRTELLKQVRGLGVNVPVIMITANADNKAAAEALSGGVFAYIPKPFDIRHLDHLVALATSRAS